jgi:hypothetical protein
MERRGYLETCSMAWEMASFSNHSLHSGTSPVSVSPFSTRSILIAPGQTSSGGTSNTKSSPHASTKGKATCGFYPSPKVYPVNMRSKPSQATRPWRLEKRPSLLISRCVRRQSIYRMASPSQAPMRRPRARCRMTLSVVT